MLMLMRAGRAAVGHGDQMLSVEHWCFVVLLSPVCPWFDMEGAEKKSRQIVRRAGETGCTTKVTASQ